MLVIARSERRGIGTAEEENGSVIWNGPREEWYGVRNSMEEDEDEEEDA